MSFFEPLFEAFCGLTPIEDEFLMLDHFPAEMNEETVEETEIIKAVPHQR